MRLWQFDIRNFKGIQNASFVWDDIIVLIGENNVGKSTALQALEVFLSGSQVKDDLLFHDKHKDEPHAIELIGYFTDLTQQEQQATAVRSRMYGTSWIIKKKFWYEEADDETNGRGGWKEQYFSFSPGEAFVGWPAEERSWRNWPNEYQDLIAEVGQNCTITAREQLKSLVRIRKPQLVVETEADWVANPGGGGNWKSNANSLMPCFIPVRAVRDASDEVVSKEASSYGKIVSLIVEKRLVNRPELVQLKQQVEDVLRLFCPDPEHPEMQAEEIREIQAKINEKLNEVVGGVARIVTTRADISPLLLPNTTLVLKDREDGLETSIDHHGHGLQRTLVMTLLQILSEIQSEPDPADPERNGGGTRLRPTILAIEEPELYLHPQMERKMRDALYKLASQRGFQVICTTHSPVFLDMGQKHSSIVRVVKHDDGHVTFSQVIQDLFQGADAANERDRLKLIANFHPTVNEVFFAKRVVLLEEQTAVSTFERAAELTGVFNRHPHARRDVTLVDCCGKTNIPMFQKVLNHFQIPYTVIHDEDSGIPVETGRNAVIGNLVTNGSTQNKRFMISPTNIESLLDYVPIKKDKPYQALKRVEDLHSGAGLPERFLTAMNWVYFGQDMEPDD